MIWQDPDSRLTFCLRAKNRNVTKHTWVSTASGTFGISLFPQKLVHTFIILLNGLDLVLLEELQKWHWQNLSHVLQIISVRAQPNTTAFHVKKWRHLIKIVAFSDEGKNTRIKKNEMNRDELIDCEVTASSKIHAVQTSAQIWAPNADIMTKKQQARLSQTPFFGRIDPMLRRSRGVRTDKLWMSARLGACKLFCCKKSEMRDERPAGPKYLSNGSIVVKIEMQKCVYPIYILKHNSWRAKNSNVLATFYFWCWAQQRAWDPDSDKFGTQITLIHAFFCNTSLLNVMR